MDWVLSTTWIQSASRLDAGEARRVLAFQRKLVEDPDCTRDSFNFEHLHHACDRRVTSLRVDQDMRAIVWRDDPVCVLLYVDHHKPAYLWAESAQVNVTCGAHGVAVAISSTTHGPEAPSRAESPPPSRPTQEPGVFDFLSERELRENGVPDALVPLIRGIHSEEELEALANALNPEFYDRLVALYLEVGGTDAGSEAEPDGPAGEADDEGGRLH